MGAPLSSWKGIFRLQQKLCGCTAEFSWISWIQLSLDSEGKAQDPGLGMVPAYFKGYTAIYSSGWDGSETTQISPFSINPRLLLGKKLHLFGIFLLIYLCVSLQDSWIKSSIPTSTKRKWIPPPCLCSILHNFPYFPLFFFWLCGVSCASVSIKFQFIFSWAEWEDWRLLTINRNKSGLIPNPGEGAGEDFIPFPECFPVLILFFPCVPGQELYV